MYIAQTHPTLRLLIACALLVALVTGCNDRQSSSTPIAVNSPDTNSAPHADQWLGKWAGPEGTFLEIAGGGGQYDIIIRNLDGPRTFQGRAAGDQIAFERDGVEEHIRATNGTDTGMKWLSEKSDCLTVRTGEGYCRD